MNGVHDKWAIHLYQYIWGSVNEIILQSYNIIISLVKNVVSEKLLTVL